MKVVVTGGTGFVGSHLVDALLAQDHDVVCLVRSPAKAERVFPNRAPRLVRGDLTDDEAIIKAIDGADIVYHVAGLIAAKNPRELFATNVEATRRLVTHVERRAPRLQRFIHVSSLAAAGPTKRAQPIDERHAPAPVSAYGQSKLGGEQVVRSSELPWTIIRPPAVYGPRDPEFLRLIKLARAPVFPLVGSPDQEFSFIYVRDLATALVHAQQEVALANTYFASHDETVTGASLIRDIAHAVLGPDRRPPRLLPIPPWITRMTLTSTGAMARLFGKATVLNSDKANELLAEAWTCSAAALRADTGWQATTPMAEGWKETVAWYRQHGWL